jgi:pimeloyl-ACP methyl ester carboxylesterase
MMTIAIIFVFRGLATGHVIFRITGLIAAILAMVFALQNLKRPDFRGSKRKLVAFGIISSLLALSLTAIWLSYNRARALVHPARIEAELTPLDVGLIHYQDVEFASRDGLTLRGWYLPPENGVVIIYVHGLGSNRASFLEEAAIFANHGYGGLLFDLRNSGASEGTLTSLGFYEAQDVIGAVDFLVSQEGVEHVAAIGFSMGGGTVLLAAAQDPRIEAVIAQAAVTSIEDNVSDSIYQLTGLTAFPFAPLVMYFGQREAGIDLSQIRPIDVIASISPRPVMLICGDQDEVVLPLNTSELYAAASTPKEIYIIAGAGHGGYLDLDPVHYPEAVLAFLDQVWR